MSSLCIPKSKHVRLIQACYPKSKTAPAHPNSSELQYLSYYTSSRPKKLLKVGFFLRQKVVKDIYWNRQNEILISIKIVTALIEKCHANLNLFALDVVEILNAVLITKDYAQVEVSEYCFAVFCKYHDGLAFGTDAQFTSAYETILRNFSSIARSSEEIDKDRWRWLGLQAIFCACTSPALLRTDSEVQFGIMVSALLDNLRECTQDVIYTYKHQLDRQRHLRGQDDKQNLVASNSVPIADRMIELTSNDKSLKEKIPLQALATLRILFETNDSTKIREATRQMVNDVRTVDRIWLGTVLEIMADWSPINLRFHIVDTCLHKLCSSDPAQSSVGIKSESTQAASNTADLLYILHSLLISRVNFIGLSTSDVLDSLLTFAHGIIYFTKTRPFMQTTDSSCLVDGQGSGQNLCVKNTFDTIAALGSHLYYEGQIADLMEHVLARIQFSNVVPDADLFYNALLIEAAYTLLLKMQPIADTSLSRARIPVTIFEPIFPLMCSSSLNLRKNTLDLFASYFEAECRNVHTKDLNCSDANREAILGRLQVVFNDAASYWGTSKEDADNWIHLLRNLSGAITPNDLVSFVPVIFSVRARFSSKFETASSYHALVLENFLSMIATRCDILLTDASPPTSTYTEPGHYYDQSIGLGHSHTNIHADSSSISRDHKTFLSGLQNSKILSISAEKFQVLCRPWLRDGNTAMVSRSASIRQTERSRFASSAAASREQLLGAALGRFGGTSSKIASLKTILMQSPETQHSANGISAQENSGYDVMNMFTGLEMYPAATKHNTICQQAESSEASSKVISDLRIVTAASNSTRVGQLGHIVNV